MSTVNQPGRLSKRSRVTDAVHDKVTHTNGDRVKRRRFSRNGGGGVSIIPKAPETPATIAHTTTTSGSARKRELDRTKKPSSVRWSVSRPVAGQYNNLDPIFTVDEEYVFLGLETAVHVYSLSTSRLFRSLQMETSHKVVGYKLCQVNREHLYIFTSSGSISKWEWTSGKRISRWDTCCKTISVDMTSNETEDSICTISYSLREQKDGKRQILIMRLNDSKISETVALETSQRLTDLKIARQGRVIMAWDSNHLLIGTANANDQSTSELQYIWKEASLPVNVTCLDLREDMYPAGPMGQDSKTRKRLESVDLVLGESGGSILIFYDALNSLPNNEDSYQSGKNPAFRRLHWHRGAVSSVRWSRDGNYIISGGHEPVMVLWQLDTARKQFLPHLSSQICNIVVSPTGNSYAVKLADNSIMILSARELRPYATITGLQLCRDALSQSTGGACRSFGATAAVLHPKHPDQLLIAVPAYHQVSRVAHGPVNSSILQTYDIRTNSHISRQALARTNATTLTIGPEGSEITTPDITHLNIAQDGKWLATIDSWRPNPQDREALGLSRLATDSDAEDCQEILLKFWRWNNSSNCWELVTRVDGPHFSDKGPVPVLDLATQPHDHGFATIGSDAVLRFWCPTTRQRSGLKTHPVEQQLETWKCRSTVDLKGNMGNTQATMLNAARMSFSEDGSVLAVCLQPQTAANHSLTLLIDSQKFEIRHSRVGTFLGDPNAIKFIGKHLVIASNQSLSVWDTVDNVVKTIWLPEHDKHISTERSSQLLAVDSKTHTFAVATQYHWKNGPSHSAKRRRKTRFHVQIYDLSSLALLYQLALGSRPLALLSDSCSGDYIVVDAAANVRRLGCLDKASGVTTQSGDLPSHLNSGLANLFGSQLGRTNLKSHLQTPATVDAGEASLSPRALTGVFGDAPSFSLPSVSVLFRDVVQCVASD